MESTAAINGSTGVIHQLCLWVCGWERVKYVERSPMTPSVEYNGDGMEGMNTSLDPERGSTQYVLSFQTCHSYS